MRKNTTKKLLYEVSFIRPFVILLLVLLHSFEKISNGGKWTNDSYQMLDIYQWAIWFIKGFRIETIALVAGYVFAYQSLVLGKRYAFGQFVKKKFFRLIIPMLAFGVIYYFCFTFDKNSFNILSFFVDLLSGCGHLWFLPMLFWCFITIWLIDHYHLSSWLLLIILAFFSIIPTPYIPFGFGRLPHFLFFVYAGYFLWEKRDYVLKRKDSVFVIVALWMFYCILVIFKNAYLVDAMPLDTFIEKLMAVSFNGAVGLLISCVGIISLFLTVCHFTEREEYRPQQWVIDASNVCYGVYVYHQFILVWLYFQTPLVAIVPNAILPWIGFIVSLSISLLLTKLTLKTKVGRFLIG